MTNEEYDGKNGDPFLKSLSEKELEDLIKKTSIKFNLM